MSRLRFALLAAAVAVTAHDATYVASHGPADYGAALGATGHDGYWAAVAGGVVAILGAVALATGWRWLHLRRRLRTMEGHAPLGGAPVVRLGAVVRLAFRVALVALAIFVVQENLELAGTTGALPGLGVLWLEGTAAAVPVFAAISLLFATLALLIGVRLSRLAIALARAMPRPDPGAGHRRERPRSERRLRPSGQPDLGRAPPRPIHAS